MVSNTFHSFSNKIINQANGVTNVSNILSPMMIASDTNLIHPRQNIAKNKLSAIVNEELEKIGVSFKVDKSCLNI